MLDFLNPKKQARERLMVSETSSSTWHYHLRLVKEGEEKMGGGAGPALCGNPLGWDTMFPLNTYNLVTHINEKFCQECARIAKKDNLPGSEQVSIDSVTRD